MTGQKSKAQQDSYEKAMAAYGLAMKVFHKGDFPKAEEALKAFVAKYPAERDLVDRALMYLAICEARIRPEKTALKTFEDYFNNGILKLNQKKYDEALQLFDSAHKKEPKAGKALFMMAVTSHLGNQDEKCLEYLKQAIELDSYFAILARNEIDFEDLLKDEQFGLITEIK